MQFSYDLGQTARDLARPTVFDELAIHFPTVAEQRAFIAGMGAVMVRLGVPAIELTHDDLGNLDAHQADARFVGPRQNLVVEIVSKV